MRILSSLLMLVAVAACQPGGTTVTPFDIVPSDTSGGDASGDATVDTPSTPGPTTFEAAMAAFGEVYCGLVQQCGCSSPTFDTCMAQFAAADPTPLLEAGLHPDVEVINARTAAYQQLGCATPRQASEVLSDVCAMPGLRDFYGDVPLGGACKDMGPADEVCDRGLTCFDGACVDPCKPVGATCELGHCGVGAYCHSASSTCRAYAQVGETCSGDGVLYFCDDGLKCGAGDTCEPLSGLDGPCEHQGHCSRELTCVDSACAPDERIWICDF